MTVDRYGGSPKMTLAVLALIFGILSFCVPGAFIAAIICGALARRYAWADPKRYGGYGMATIGFGLGGFMLLAHCVVFGIWWMMMQSAAVTKARDFEAQQKAKTEREIRLVTINNARHIATAAAAYADRNRGMYPERLAALVPSPIEPKELLAANSVTPLFFMPADAQDWRAYASEVDNCSDFIYVAGDLPQERAHEHPIIVVYSKSMGRDGRAVATSDGHVEWVPEGVLPEKFARSNDSREYLGLGALAIDSRVPGKPGIAAGSGRDPGSRGTPVENVRINFGSVTEALSFVSNGKPEERYAALGYLSRMTPVPDPAVRDQVFFKIEPLLADGSLHTAAFIVLKTWATNAELPLIRATLEKIAQGSIACDPNDVRVLLGLVSKMRDIDSVRPVAQLLKYPSVADAVQETLAEFGNAAEPAVLPLIAGTEKEIVLAAMSTLEKCGTENSILPLHRALYSKNEDIAQAAQTTLKALATRLGLRPEDYQNRLLDHFVIEGPEGFTEERSTLNTRLWTRQAPGRMVKSSFQVEARWIERGTKVDAPLNAPTMLANGLVLQQIAAQGNNITQSVRWGAVQGEYMLLITATADMADRTAAPGIEAAVLKIREK